MPKVNNIIDMLEAGLKAEDLRRKAIASNVANLESPGYRTVDVRFEEFLAKALDSSGAVDLDGIESQLYQANATALKSNGKDVSLEAEVGKMVKNDLLYTTYIRLISKRYHQIELAIDVK